MYGDDFSLSDVVVVYIRERVKTSVRRDWPFNISLERKIMESMVVTKSETIEREIDISNDIREGEENVYGSPIPDPRREAARSDNEEIAGVSSDNVDRIFASGCAKTRKARMPESRNTKNRNHQNKGCFTRTTKA